MRKIILLALLLALVGCTTPNIREDVRSIPSSDSAYLAGSFINSYRESYARLALELTEKASSSIVLVELHQPDDYQGVDLIAVQPGIYTIDYLARLAATGGYNGKSEIELNEVSAEFEVQPEAIYYIGDYDGRSTNDLDSLFLVGGYVSLNMKRGQTLLIQGQDVESVKKKILHLYPEFSHLEVIDVFDLNKALQRTGR